MLRFVGDTLKSLTLIMQGGRAVRAVAQSPARVRHDFDAAGVCTAVLRLALRNCLPSAASVSVRTGAGADGGAEPCNGPLNSMLDKVPVGPGELEECLFVTRACACHAICLGVHGQMHGRNA